MYWASGLVNFYIDNANQLFPRNNFNTFLDFMIYALLVIFFGGILFLTGKYNYDNPKVKKAQ